MLWLELELAFLNLITGFNVGDQGCIGLLVLMTLAQELNFYLPYSMFSGIDHTKSDHSGMKIVVR